MPETSKKEIAALLAVLADALKHMSEEDFSALVAGSGKLRFVGQRMPATQNKAVKEQVDIERIADRLKEAATREEAEAILSAMPAGRRKDALSGLARQFQVYITKQDTISRIEEKIIESVVGAKIRSKAIQSLPM